MLNLQDITNVYNQMFEITFVETFVVTAKVIGALLIVISIYSRLFKNFGRFEQLLVKEKEESSLPYILIRGLVLIVIISLSTEIFTLTDNVFAAIEKEFVEQHMESFDLMEFAKDPYSEEESEEEEFSIFNVEHLLSVIVSKIHKILSGSWLISGFMGMLMYMFDGIIYGLFLCERFFVLGMLKLLAPLIIAFSIFEKFRDKLYELIKVFLRWYLVIIPFFAVNIFCGMIVSNMPGAMTSIAGETGGEMLFNSARVLFYLFLIILKFKLYNRSRMLMQEIIK